MRAKILLLAVLLLPVWPVPVSAVDSAPSAYEARVLSAFAAGDYFALYDGIEAMLLKYPGAPEAALYLTDLVTLADVYGHARVDGSLSRIAARLEEEKQEHAGLYGLMILLQKERLARRYMPEKSAEIVKRLRPVASWRVSGPYHRYGAADIDHVFLPEIAAPATGEEARWKRVSADEKNGGNRFFAYAPTGKGRRLRLDRHRARTTGATPGVFVVSLSPVCKRPDGARQYRYGCAAFGARSRADDQRRGGVDDESIPGGRLEIPDDRYGSERYPD